MILTHDLTCTGRNISFSRSSADGWKTSNPSPSHDPSKRITRNVRRAQHGCTPRAVSEADKIFEKGVKAIKISPQLLQILNVEAARFQFGSPEAHPTLRKNLSDTELFLARAIQISYDSLPSPCTQHLQISLEQFRYLIDLLQIRRS